MRTKFDDCIRKGLISKANIDPVFLERELADAGEGLQQGRKALQEGDYVNAILYGRSSQVHSVRALIFSEGYRDKREQILPVAAETLLLDRGLIRSDIIEDFEYAIKNENPSENPEYLHESIAGDIIRGAGRIYKRACVLLEKNL